ncbi:MAG: hypothetical protein LBF61_12980 [Azoarcus sp.]|jgi:hypothetical protein|nr:hypothetical protein [Azoarcus sp.]
MMLSQNRIEMDLARAMPKQDSHELNALLGASGMLSGASSPFASVFVAFATKTSKQVLFPLRDKTVSIWFYLLL